MPLIGILKIKRITIDSNKRSLRNIKKWEGFDFNMISMSSRHVPWQQKQCIRMCELIKLAGVNSNARDAQVVRCVQKRDEDPR